METAVAATADVLASGPDPVSVLTPAELRRAGAFHRDADRDDFVAAHLLARTCVARLLGSGGAELAQRCPTCGGEHGRPSVVGHPEVSVSWSHTRGHVAAVADRSPVGIDVELVGRRRDVAGLVRRTATPDEAARILAAADPALAYLRMWVVKEALVKVGALELAGFRSVDVGGGRHADFVLEVAVRPRIVVGLARR